MGKGSRLLRGKLCIADETRYCYQTLELSPVLHPSEKIERLLARLIAYALEYEPGLAFGGGISSTGEAPIWLRDQDERVIHWIDLGQPDEERLEKQVRRVERLSLYLYGPQALRWWQQHGSAMKGVDAMQVVLLDWAVLETLAAHLGSGFELGVTRSEDQLYLSLGEQSTEMSLQRLAAGWRSDH
ncbi:YaeQ family protein [Motiliproteus sediminis]|uniref:YaeQ family protein n=1 Tax=Motiliproteus sediminis TaxID=1468178 RepID=UPI001AEFC43E|nr:YaeQ family protein [Motiliproteus sediminis]